MSKKKKEKPQPSAQPSASFSSLVFMLATGALQHLGLIENPTSKKNEKNLPMAKLTIDTLRILKDKTEGNLEPEEKKLFEDILYDLKMKYLKEGEA